MGRCITDLPMRIRKRIVVTDEGCWYYTGSKTPKGYTCIYNSEDKKIYRGHRLVWYLLTGKWPEYELDHTCHNPQVCRLKDDCPHRACLNPDHMQDVTHALNNAKSLKYVEFSEQKFCINNHPYTLENTYISPKRGTRGCKTCRQAAKDRHAHKLRDQTSTSGYAIVDSQAKSDTPTTH